MLLLFSYVIPIPTNWMWPICSNRIGAVVVYALLMSTVRIDFIPSFKLALFKPPLWQHISLGFFQEALDLPESS